MSDHVNSGSGSSDPVAADSAALDPAPAGPTPLDPAPSSYPDLGPEPVPEVRLFAVPAVPTAVVRANGVRMATIAELFDSVFGTAFPEAFHRGLVPIGPAFALYTSIGDEPEGVADVEIGFPVAQVLEQPTVVGELTVVPSELPAGEAAVISHIGGYDQLDQAWGSFMNAIDGEGRIPGIPFWEAYVTEPTPGMDPSTLRTDLYCRLGHPDDAA